MRQRNKKSAAVTGELLDGTPPSDADAEKSVLGSILLVADACDDVAMIICEDDFYHDANRIIYRELLEMRAKSKRIDPTLLSASLKKSGNFELVGGNGYIAELMNATYTAAHAADHARNIRRHAAARQMIYAGTEILKLGYDPEPECGELINRGEEIIFRIRDSHSDSSESIASVREVLQSAMAQLDSRIKGDVLHGIPTGYADLDQVVSLCNGSLIVLAARPSMGKSALALNIAEHVATSHAPVLFCSLEMSAGEIGDRLLARSAEVDLRALQQGRLSDTDRQRIVAASGELKDLRLVIDDSSRRSVLEIAATARRMKRREGLGLVVVDYIQLITPEDAKAPREQQVANIARRLKGMARELSVPVLVLAQLNRQSESTSDNKPKLSHLRESGAIEQDADLVLFVHRPEYYIKDEQARAAVLGKAEINIAKQRNGPTGTVELVWRGKYTSFENMAVRDMPNYEQSFEAYNAFND